MSMADSSPVLKAAPTTTERSSTPSVTGTKKRKMSGWDRHQETKKKKLREEAKSTKSIFAFFSASAVPASTTVLDTLSTLASCTSAIISVSAPTTSSIPPIIDSTLIPPASSSNTSLVSAPTTSSNLVSDCSEPTYNDIGVHCGKANCLNDDQKYKLLRKHFVPGHHYTFPSTEYAGRKRTFQLSWLEKYQGLVYSPSREGVFCIFCALFGEKNQGRLVNAPLLDMAHAHQKLNEHFSGNNGVKKNHTCLPWKRHKT